MEPEVCGKAGDWRMAIILKEGSSSFLDLFMDCLGVSKYGYLLMPLEEVAQIGLRFCESCSRFRLSQPHLRFLGQDSLKMFLTPEPAKGEEYIQ